MKNFEGKDAKKKQTGSYFGPVKFASKCLMFTQFVYIISSSCTCVFELEFSDIPSYIFCFFASHPFYSSEGCIIKPACPSPTSHYYSYKVTRWRLVLFVTLPIDMWAGRNSSYNTWEQINNRGAGSRSKKMGQGWKKEPRQPISTWIATKAAYKCAPQVSSPLSFNVNVFALCLRNTSQFSDIFNPFANVNVKKYKIDVFLFFWHWITVLLH